MSEIMRRLRGCYRSAMAFPSLALRLGKLESDAHEHREQTARLEVQFAQRVAQVEGDATRRIAQVEGDAARRIAQVEADAAKRLAWLESAVVEHNGRLDELVTLVSKLREEQAKIAPLQQLLHDEAIPFAWMAPPPNWIERADRRLGRPAATLAAEERKDAFYSYYSEMGGDHAPILRQQYQAYLPLLQQAASGGGRVLDIGCGAGEFLSFLRSQQLTATGVDLSASEVQRAAAAGLDAVCTSAGDFLACTQERFAAITMFQVIEHLAPEEVLPTLEACVNRLMPGGVLMVETINMRHPMAVNGFYTDPTHSKPLSDNYMSFLMQWLGLQDVGVLYTLPEPLPGVSKDEPQRLYANYTAFGFAPRAA